MFLFFTFFFASSKKLSACARRQAKKEPGKNHPDRYRPRIQLCASVVYSALSIRNLIMIRLS